MAFFPGQFNQAGGTWVDPSRVQTSQSGGAYIGGMAPQLPTQDMSFMWGGNGGAAAPAPSAGTQGWLGGQSIGAQAAATNWSPSSITTYGGNGSTSTGGDPTRQQAWDALGPGGPMPTFTNPNPLKNDPNFTPIGGGMSPAPSSIPAAQPGWSQSMLNAPSMTGVPDMSGIANGSIAGPSAAGNSLDLGYGNGMPGSYAAGAGASAYGGGGDPYLSGRADDITNRTKQMLGESFAGIAGNAVGTGGLGGSRQAVAQGQAGAKAADYMSGQLANMYSNDWNQSQNRNLQNKSLDNSFFLGNQGQQIGAWNTGRALDQSQYDLGLKALGLSQSGAWAPVQGMTGAVSPYTGNGTTTVNTSSGGGWPGILGGMGAGYQWWNGLNK